MSVEWQIHEITTWREFVQWVEKMGWRPARFLCRGEADHEWAMLPSFTREVKGMDIRTAIAVERELRDTFSHLAHLHLPASYLPERRARDAFLAWWSLMQQHSAPTRLLDWTKSPYVAAYFAVEDLSDKAGVVWAFDKQKLWSKLNEHEIDAVPREENDYKETPLCFGETDIPLIYSFALKMVTERMFTQQSEFTISTNVFADHGQVIAQILGEAERGVSYTGARIPGAIKREFLGHLRLMNITASALFPGIDGVGRMIREALHLAGPSRE